MRIIRDVLIIIASISLIIYVGDVMVSKYKINKNLISCSSDSVHNLLINVIIKDTKKSIENQGFIVNTNILKESVITKDRKATIDNKAIYTCRSTIEVLIKANPNNLTNIKFIRNIANQGNDTFKAIFNKDYTITENDLGTTFWVNSQKILEYEISSLMKK